MSLSKYVARLFRGCFEPDRSDLTQLTGHPNPVSVPQNVCSILKRSRWLLTERDYGSTTVHLDETMRAESSNCNAVQTAQVHVAG